MLVLACLFLALATAAEACEPGGDCQVDEAGLLQLANNNGASPPSEEAPAELVQALAKVEETLDARETLSLMPGNLKAAMQSLAELPSREGQGPSADACPFDKTGDCPVADLKTSGFTSITPSAKWGTACMNSKLPHYAFQVYPGHSEKLLLYFQDGGACWDALSANLPHDGSKGACTQEVWETGPVGIFDKSDMQNPYRDFTAVHVNYCSGDAHAGDAVHAWGRQAGYNNSLAAVSWALANFGNRELDSLVVAGASAGALGTQIWSRRLLKDFRYKRAEVLVDSYLGIFPPNTQPYILDKIFRTCSTPLGKGWSKECGRNLEVQDVVDEAMGMYPEVPFIFINSKGDSVQSIFYSAIAFTIQARIALLDSRLLYTLATKIMHRYNKNPNFLVFQVDGDEHMFLPRSRCTDADSLDCTGDMYSATPYGPLAGFEGNGELLCDWLEQATNQVGDAVLTNKCHGIPSMPPVFFPFPTTHCDKAFSTKKLRFVSGMLKH